MKRLAIVAAVALLTISFAALATDPTAPRTDVHGSDSTLVQGYPAGYGVIPTSTVLITVPQSQPPPNPFSGLKIGCNIADYTSIPATNGNPCTQRGLWTTGFVGQTLMPGHWQAYFYVDTSSGALVGGTYKVTWTWTMNHATGNTSGGSCASASCVVNGSVMPNNNFGQRINATARIVYVPTGAVATVQVTASNSACGTRNYSTNRTIECQ